MTTPDEITRLGQQGESETVEFKISTGQRQEAARTLSAMLNGRGGRVMFGVGDNGIVVGQQVGGKTLTDITNACQEIRPHYAPAIERVDLPDSNGNAVLVVTVPAGREKPYSFKGRHYVRSGAATVDMPGETHLALVLIGAHGRSRWELEASGFGLDVIDEREVFQFRDEALESRRARFDENASVEDVLRALNLLGAAGEPNRGAIVLFGRTSELRGQFPVLGCRMVAVRGTEIAEDFLDDDLIEDNVFASLRRSEDFCREHLHRPVRIGEGLRAEVGHEIPLAVMREALANAFAHRDYALSGFVQIRVFSNRLEVWSPGGLHFGLSPADLYEPHSSYPWNPNILGCMYRRGLVEQLGSGTLRMVRLCVEAGLGRPAFSATQTSVTCSIPRRGHWLTPGGVGLEPTEAQSAVLTALANGPRSRGELASRLDTGASEVRQFLNQLRDMGFVRVQGHGRGARWALNDS